MSKKSCNNCGNEIQGRPGGFYTHMVRRPIPIPERVPGGATAYVTYYNYEYCDKDCKRIHVDYLDRKTVHA